MGSIVAALALVFVVFSISGQLALSNAFGIAICWFGAFALVYGVVSRTRHGIERAKDRLATVFIWTGSLIAMLPLIFIIGWLLFKGLSVVLAGFPHFLLSDSSKAGPSDPVSKAGVGAAIVGSLEQVGIATLVAAPLSILTATYLNESKSALSRVVRLVVDAMTGTPEIIAGLFVYLLWVQPRHTNGQSGVAASMALGIMMLPFVTRGAQEVLKTVPGSLREAGLALGAPQWRLTLRVVLPTAKVALLTVTILGVARAVGETAAVYFTAGGSATQKFNWNPFHGIQLDLPLYVVQFAKVSSPTEVREAWGGALVLVFMVLLLFTVTRVISKGNRGKRRRHLVLPAWRRGAAAKSGQ
ncbi:MAG TPA: phosphate ABC transporter permease PstA [Acidimicrobiales bacterium]|nr:phosphate ABC transporter permease PstA [Acidimicrobiales bacterium]